MARISVNVDVDDLSRAAAFYCEAFELRIGRRLGEDVVELLGAEAPIFLLAKPRGSRPFESAATTRDYARHWTPVHLDFLVRDLDAAVARAQSAGAILEGELAEFDWGRLGYFADPFGHGFCLLQFTAAGYDAI
jgi:predicted enzyme related to lactoylglutathione lyase